MPRATYFVQECPTCGRRLQVRIEDLGKSVRCQHCGAGFEAMDPANGGCCSSPVKNPLIDRVERLLETVDQLVPKSGRRL